MKMVKNLINVFAITYMTTAIHQNKSSVIQKYMVDPKWLEVWEEPVWTWAVAKQICHALAHSSAQGVQPCRAQQPR